MKTEETRILVNIINKVVEISEKRVTYGQY